MIHVEHLDGCKVWAYLERGGIALYPTCDAGHEIGDEGEAALDRAMDVLVAAVGNARCEVEDTPEVHALIGSVRSGSGQGILIDWLEKNDAVALAERKAIRCGTDHSCLVRYDGTDICQWHARNASGYFNAYGRPMRIVGHPTN